MRLRCFFVFLLAVCSAIAQTRSTSNLKVRVTDSTGAVIVGASISVENESTGIKADSTTNDHGEAYFAGLPLTGSYMLTVSKSGFNEAQRTGIQLEAGKLASADILLNVSGDRS